MEKKEKKLSMLPIFLTVLIDMIGTTILIPVLAPLFLSPSALFTPETSFATRTFLLGLAGASFPFAQFFGAPILGALSDKYGRKPILLLSLTGTLFARLLFAFGIIFHSLPLIIISPIIDGFTGGNISIAMSAIADISDPKQKAKNFGLIGMSFGIGFVLGPFLGGVLTNAKILPLFSFATPYFFTVALTLFNIILMSFNFKETLSKKVASHVSLLTGVRNFKKAFSTPNIRTMFTVVFLLNFGFMFFILNPLLAVFQGLTQPNLTATVSDLANKSDQGEILGINQSVMSLAWALPPLLGGIILAIDINLPLVFGSLSILLGWITFTFFFKPKKHFQEN